MQQLKLGQLNSRIVGDPAQAQTHLFLCHGFGASGTDLVPLANELHELNPDLKQSTAFIFPEAPHSLDDAGIPGGRAWWPINMAGLQQMLQTNDFQALTSSEPPGMAAAREMFLDFLQQYCNLYNTPIERCILGGFSQGAMLATDITLRLPVSPAGLIVYSGTLLCESEWTQLAPQRSDLPVLQTHGTADPILPFSVAEQLRDLLIEAGLKVKFEPFNGPHTIPWPALAATVNLIRETSPTT